MWDVGALPKLVFQLVCVWDVSEASMPIRSWHISQLCSQRSLAALHVIDRDVTHGCKLS